MVLYQDAPTRAIEQVVADTRAREGELAPLPAGELLADSDPVVVGGRVQGCHGPPADSRELRDAIARAGEALHVDVRPEEAWGMLAPVQGDRLACLSDPATAALGTDLHFLLAKTAWALDDRVSARDALRRVLLFSPDFRIPQTDAQDAAPMLEAERSALQEAASATVRVVSAAPVSLWIDGRSQGTGDQGVSVPPGVYLVQLLQPRVQTWLLSLEPGEDASVVLPDALDGDLAARVEDPEQRRHLAWILRAAGLADRPAVYVPTRERTWRWSPVDDTWTVAERSAGQKLAWPLVVGGGAVLAGGAVIATTQGLALAGVNEELDAFDADLCYQDPACDEARYQDLHDQAEPRAAWANAGLVAAGVGTVALGAGTWLSLQDRSLAHLAILPLPGGVYAALELPW